MSPEELKARARRVVEETLNQGDLAVANELISPDCVHHVPGGQPAPGLAGLIGWLALTQRIFPDFHAIVEDEIAEGDRVVQRITCYGTHQGEFCGVRPTGEQVTFPSIEINRAGSGREVRRALVLGRPARRPAPSRYRASATARQRAEGMTPMRKAAQADQVAVGGSRVTARRRRGASRADRRAHLCGKLTAAPASAEDWSTAGPPDRAAVQARPVRRITAALWIATLLAALAGLALTLVAWGDLKISDGISSLYLPVAAVAYATLGVLIIRRAANLIGWIMLAEGIGIAFLGLTSVYAVTGVAAYPGSLPAAKLAGTLSECIFSPVTFLIAFMFLLFPTGKLPSPRWRPVAAAGFLLVGLTLTGLVVTPRLLQLPAPGGVSLVYPNPLGVESLEPTLRAVPVGTLNGLAVVTVAFMAAVLVSLAVRYRVGGRLMRQQIKWLALAAVVFAVLLFIALLGLVGGEVWLNGAANGVTAVVALFGIPAAMAIAILRHRLYDIDVIISRAVVYGLLSAAFTGVYIGIVLGIGTFVGHQGGPVLTIAAAVTIALLFQPLRRRAQLFANRLVYGRRATPYQALSDFAGDMAGQLDLTEAVDKMVSVLAGATGADRAEAWIRVGRSCARPRSGRTGHPHRPPSRSAPAAGSRPSRGRRARQPLPMAVSCWVRCRCRSRGMSR